MTVRDLRLALAALPQEKEVALLLPLGGGFHIREFEPVRVREGVLPPRLDTGDVRFVVLIDCEEVEDYPASLLPLAILCSKSKGGNR